jgi:hypothetical protein
MISIYFDIPTGCRSFGMDHANPAAKPKREKTQIRRREVSFS